MILIAFFVKDTLESNKLEDELQLRPNQTMAMAISPKLFKNPLAMGPLQLIQNRLASERLATQNLLDKLTYKVKIGIKSLDKNDPNYRGRYDLSENPSDPLISRGFSYHNGPEWTHMRLFHNIAMQNNNILDKYTEITKFKKVIDSNPYSSLPELTNCDGEKCGDSCDSQAWSLAKLIDLTDLIKH